MRFLIRLSFADGEGMPYSRTVLRANRAEAIDAAQRLLRLSRRTSPAGMKRFDTWQVCEPVPPGTYWPIAAGVAE
jgi:hypothetical protein